MPGPNNRKGKTPMADTRKVARVVFSTIKKIGHSRGVTLKKIHDYIKEEYPNSQANIVRLNNTLEKALAFGAVNKKIGNRLALKDLKTFQCKNRHKRQWFRYVLGAIIKSLEKPNKRRLGITQARRKRRKSRGRKKRGRKGRRHSYARRTYKART